MFFLQRLVITLGGAEHYKQIALFFPPLHSCYVAKAEYLIITKREVTLDEVSVPWRALPKNKGLISSVVLGEASRRYRALKVRLSLQKKEML